MTAHEWGPTKGMLPQQRTALRNLMDTKGFDERPCADAVAWDIEATPGWIDHAEAEVRINACMDCQVFTACLTYARTHPDVIGVLAGLSDHERATHAPTDQEAS